MDRARIAATGGNPDAEPYFERKVRGALMEGLALRGSCIRGSREVEFARAFPGVDKSWVTAVYRPDGHLRVLSGAEMDSLGNPHARRGAVTTGGDEGANH